VKTIQVEISAACGTNGLPPQLLAQVGPAFDWHADEHNAFNLVAMTTAPPTYVGFSLADTWAHMRYFAAIDPGNSHLSLRREWNELDPHQKTILADDWGVGFPLLYLMEQLDLVHLAPTGYWIKSIEEALGIKIPLKKSKHGPPKLPDFVAFDTSGRYHAIECKGTQTSRRSLMSAITRGFAQVDNLRQGGALPGNVHAYFDSWLVAGLFVPSARSNTRPLLHIADPDFSELSRVIDESGGINVLRRAIFVTSLCQQLSCVGLRRLASAVFTGKTLPGDDELLRVEGEMTREARIGGFFRDGEKLVTTRETQVYDPPRRDTKALMHDVKALFSAPAPLVESLSDVIGLNGQVNRQALDARLDELMNSIPGAEPSLQRRQTRVRTPWTATQQDGLHKLTSPFGIEISTETSMV
jgi:hypothetical protein